MRSFFKRPSWASRGDENLPPEFYRRAGQTYGDIVAASIEARSRAANNINEVSTEDDNAYRQEQNTVGRVTMLDGRIPCHLEPEFSCDGMTGPSKDVGNENIPRLPESPSVDRVSAPEKPESSFPRQDDSLDPCCSTGSISMPNETSQYIVEEQPGYHKASTSINQKATDGNSSCMPEDDGVVQILITSNIENTKPLIVHRKVSQPLKNVRLAWCNHQNFPREAQSSVYLTWKGRRLFDVTTCRSLGISSQRNCVRTSILDLEPDEESFRVHVEAVIDDASKPGILGGPVKAYMETETGHTDDTKFDPCSPRIRVVLKCPGIDHFVSSLGFKSPISELVIAFRNAKNLSLKNQVYLVFDGDRLDPQLSLSDYEIADDDLVDVVIK